jgi:hypothetical protein
VGEVSVAQQLANLGKGGAAALQVCREGMAQKVRSLEPGVQPCSSESTMHNITCNEGLSRQIHSPIPLAYEAQQMPRNFTIDCGRIAVPKIQGVDKATNVIFLYRWQGFHGCVLGMSNAIPRNCSKSSFR